MTPKETKIAVQKIDKKIAAKKYSDALQLCKHLIARQPGLSTPYQQTINCLFKLGNHKEIIKTYEAIQENIQFTEATLVRV